MTSILTNNSAMMALQTLNMVNKNLTETQGRVSSGLAISSGKDNAAYFAISETMKGDSGMFEAINEGLTSTRNSISAARLGAEAVAGYAKQFSERVAFAQGSGVNLELVQAELDTIVAQIGTAISQATFNGADLVSGAVETQTVVSGISRTGGTFSATTMTFDSVNLGDIQTALDAVDLVTDGATSQAALQATLSTAEAQLGLAIEAATSLGVAEKSIEAQQSFLGSLTDTLDLGVSSMVDAKMEEEAARLQALQTQQQLATQALAMANSSPQSVLSLFR